MPRNRAAAIMIHDNAVLVMYRKNTREYYTFPGGGIEAGETSEQAVIREIKEETSIDVQIEKQVYELHFNNGDTHYYFLCTYIEGIPHLQVGSNEYIDTQKGHNIYVPVWLPIKDLQLTTVYPLEVRDRLLVDSETGFSDTIVDFEVTVSR